jgi:hypothetical protein
MFVPFDAGDLARLAPDAGGDVYVFADLIFAARAGAGYRSRMRRDFLNLKCSWVSHATRVD